MEPHRSLSFAHAPLVLPLLRPARIQLNKRIPRATADLPPQRRAALAALAATSAVSFVVGAPGLAASAFVFTGIGVLAEAPVALVGLAAALCAGMADLIAIDFGSASFDRGWLPFLLFALGSGVAGVLETSADGPFARNLGAGEGGNARAAVEEVLREEEKEKRPGSADFRDWDDKFRDLK